MPDAAVQPRVCVVQDGARLHYAVPIALQRAGALDRVYTDWYAAGSLERVLSALLSPIGGSRLRRMRERVAIELDLSRVHTKPSLALQQFRRRQFASDTDFYAMLRQRTARWIKSAGFGQANSLFGYVRNIDPSLCSAARSAGLKVVVDQIIAPWEIERAEAAKQQVRYPDWESGPADQMADHPLEDVERRTWQSADCVTCASDYVATSLEHCGVETDKIAVEPYPFDSRSVLPTDRRGRTGPVTVGFIGTLGLRKGVPAVLELAGRFDPAKVRFVLVGPSVIAPEILQKHRGAAEIVGPVPRSHVAGWLKQFDVFLLPSTCEGSAGAVAEAMAAGLPVVVSPNAGAPITPGVEGLVAPYDDLDGFERHLADLAADADRRHAMGLAARQRIELFDLDRYGRRLAGLFDELLHT